MHFMMHHQLRVQLRGSEEEGKGLIDRAELEPGAGLGREELRVLDHAQVNPLAFVSRALSQIFDEVDGRVVVEAASLALLGIGSLDPVGEVRARAERLQGNDSVASQGKSLGIGESCELVVGMISLHTI